MQNATRCRVFLAVAVFAMVTGPAAIAGQPRSAVELFTSLGCSSCPPADAVAGRLSQDPSILVLSFHVDYWDGFSFRDPFSSKDGTARQYDYAKALHEPSVFTPQLIVDGTHSLVGSQENAIRAAVQAANQAPFPVDAQLAQQPDGSFTVTLAGAAAHAEIWEVRYVRRSTTKVGGGENGGHTLQTFNDVTRLRRVGNYKSGTFQLAPLKQPDDGIAVLVQTSNAGPILGAVSN